MRTLTERYVHTVVRRLPEGMRDDVAADVTAMIADMLEARTDTNTDADTHTGTDADPAVAEAAVLEELGSPESLAQEYARGPQHLIGPAVFPAYRWALTWVLPVVVAVALAVNGLVYALTAPEVHIGGLIGTSVGKAVPALLVAFATLTVLFAVYERVGTAPAPGLRGHRRWTVDQLAEPTPSGSTVRADGVVSLVMLVLLALVPVVPTTLVYVGHLNGGETFVNPQLGAGWLFGYWLILLLMAAGPLIHAVRGRTTRATRVWDIVTDLVMASFLTLALLSQPVLHPDLAAASGIDIAVWLIPVIWAVTLWDQIATVRAHRSSLRTMPAPTTAQ
ncbi:HAAS signaling domain-containing protein [Brevibacterium yomogidense]|uniref:HAAS signaling domain-containing protein n=1 Tax=Brevibacterium yomogidense TaxID=946573 RepID=UPI0018DF8B71|nr:hypothetical protein [Brevibacterium yomogidense]